MKIEQRTQYQIKGKSKYFKQKYKTYNPIIWIEDLVINMPGNETWKKLIGSGNIAAALYSSRMDKENLPDDDNVYYGKIETSDMVGCMLGEMVHESELEEVKPKVSLFKKIFS